MLPINALSNPALEPAMTLATLPTSVMLTACAHFAQTQVLPAPIPLFAKLMEFAISTVLLAQLTIFAFKDHLTDAKLETALLVEPNVMRVPTETLMSVLLTHVPLAHLMDLHLTAHLVHSARLQRLP